MDERWKCGHFASSDDRRQTSVIGRPRNRHATIVRASCASEGKAGVKPMPKISKSALEIQEIIHQRISVSHEHGGACSEWKITVPSLLTLREQLRLGSNWRAKLVISPQQLTSPQCIEFVSGVIEDAMEEFVCANQIP
jgi:hypothetical protein